MADTTPAVFQLNKFVIPKFTFEEVDNPLMTIDIKLNPTGMYNTSNGDFQLVLVFTAFSIPENKDEESRLIISAALKAFYTLNQKPSFEEIPEYFYQNSIAIIFPYLRAFVSNMTLQAGSTLLILPLLNLMSLATILKENTQVFK